MDAAYTLRRASTSTREKREREDETSSRPGPSTIFPFHGGHARRDTLLLCARLCSLHGFLFTSMKSSLQHCSLSACLRFVHALRLVLAPAEPARAQTTRAVCLRTDWLCERQTASAGRKFRAPLWSSVFSVIRSFRSVVVPRSPSLSFSALQSTRPGCTKLSGTALRHCLACVVLSVRARPLPPAPGLSSSPRTLPATCSSLRSSGPGLSRSSTVRPTRSGRAISATRRTCARVPTPDATPVFAVSRPPRSLSSGQAAAPAETRADTRRRHTRARGIVDARRREEAVRARAIDHDRGPSTWPRWMDMGSPSVRRSSGNSR
jgi:hypothetical protein